MANYETILVDRKFLDGQYRPGLGAFKKDK